MCTTSIIYIIWQFPSSFYVYLYSLIIFIRLVVLALFLAWRIKHQNTDAVWLWGMSVVCEIWFAFSWLLDQLPKLCPVNRSTDLNVLGDFNSIRSQDERTGSSQRSVGTYDSSGFNDWISDMEIQEIKSFGNRFTWCRPNGYVRSRLDRCLVSEQWLLKWPDSSQQVLHKDYCDHCPIILKTELVDWGPKPFRVMDCWLKNKEYQRLVKEVWCGDQQLGWGSIVLKNKLRNLKSSLKQWSIENGDVNNNKIQQLML